MYSALKEYGLIVVVIAAAMMGYLFYNYNKEAVIDYALDNIGERLVQLLDSESNQDAVRQKFAALKSRILDQEVESAAVEQMAANVLNLSAAGAPITMDEADLLFSEVYAYEAEAMAAAADASVDVQVETKGSDAAQARAKTKKVQIELKQLGAHLASVIKAEEDFRHAAKASGASAALPPFVIASSDQGLRFHVDSMMVEMLANGTAPESIRELEKHKMIVWEKHLAEKRKMGYEKSLEELEHVQKHLEKALAMRDIAISQAGESMEISITLAPEMIDRIRVIKELESKGVWVGSVPDSVKRIVITGPGTTGVTVSTGERSG
jgi:Flp pilus assembly pilin Flp